MADKSIEKNSLYSLIKSISSVIFPLITFPYISRILQPENIGKYNFSSSIVSYFSMFASLGVTTYAVRECAKFRNDKNILEKCSSEIISINFFTSVISYITLIITMFLVPSLQNYMYLIFIQSISIIFTTMGADWINTAMEDFKYITIRTLGFQIISIILMFICVRNPNDYIKYAIIISISANGGNLCNIFYRKKYCRIHLTFKLNLRKHLKPILALFAMIVAQQIFTVSDTTMIGFFYGDYEVGLYSTAIRTYNVVNQVVASVTWVVMPQLSLYFSKKRYEEGKKVLNYAYSFILTIGLPVVIVIFFLSREVIMIVGGTSYIEASASMKILAITLGLAFIACYLLNINILASGQDKVGLAACIIPALFNLITNYIFIPSFGIEAAAWTTVASQIIIIAICIPFLPKGFESIKIVLRNWNPYIAGIVLTALCYFVTKNISNISLRLFLCIGVGGGIYIGILLFTKYKFLMDLLKDTKTKLFHQY